MTFGAFEIYYWVEFRLKITIFTVCFNATTTINDALNTVAKQMNVEIEHIVVDGGSTDQTLEIVNKL